VGNGKDVDIFDKTPPRELHLVAIEASLMNMTCGNTLLKQLLSTNQEKMLGNQNAVCGEYSPMQPISSSFTSMKMESFGVQINTSSTSILIMNNKSPLSIACGKSTHCSNP